MSMLLSKDIMRESYYDIKLGGIKLADKYKKFITEVSVEESDSEADLGRITIMDKEHIFLDNPKLDEGLPIEIVMGHKSKNRLMLKGEVTHVEADFNEDGIPVITIGAIDNTTVMTYKKKTRTWKNKTASEIVNEIAKSYGFNCTVLPTNERIEQVTQDNETDAQLISKLADDEAYQWYYLVDRDEIYFGKRFDGVIVKDELNYNKKGKTVRSFRPNFVKKNKQVTESSSNISEDTGNTVTKTVTTINK